VTARDAHRELFAQPEDRVIGAARPDAVQRQARPPGKLLGEEPAHERLVDVELVVVHAGRHCRPSTSRRHAATQASVPLPS